MTPLETAQYMLNQDFFSQWMDIKLVEVREHYCLIEMPIKKEMINGLKTVHGGVTFAFADSALAFSSNNMGDAAVALNCMINFTKAVRFGDTLLPKVFSWQIPEKQQFMILRLPISIKWWSQVSEELFIKLIKK